MYHADGICTTRYSLAVAARPGIVYTPLLDSKCVTFLAVWHGLLLENNPHPWPDANLWNNRVFPVGVKGAQSDIRHTISFAFVLLLQALGV